MSFLNNPDAAFHSNNLNMQGRNGFNSSLIYGIGSQFMPYLLSGTRRLFTVTDFLDDLSDLAVHQLRLSSGGAVEVNMDALATSSETFAPIYNARGYMSPDVASSLSSDSSTASASTAATSLFSVEEEAINPVVAAPIPVLAGTGGNYPHVGGGGLSYSILRMLGEVQSEMPWSAAVMGATFHH